MSNIGGAFAFPNPPTSTFGQLTTAYDEIDESYSIDGSAAAAEQAQAENDLALEQYLGQVQVEVFSGLLGSTGGTVFAHNLVDAQRRVYHVGAFYKTAAGAATLFAQAPVVDAANVTLAGGGNGAAYRCVLLLLPAPVGW